MADPREDDPTVVAEQKKLDKASAEFKRLEKLVSKPGGAAVSNEGQNRSNVLDSIEDKKP